MSFEGLEEQIRNCTRCGENRFCPFPTYQGVKGFYGDKDYIFVAGQPSESIFPTRWDKRLFKFMADNKFSNAHLTDLVKCRGKAGKQLSQYELNNCVGWLSEEINIVNPKAIIALGNKAFDELKIRFRPVVCVTHYSDRFINDSEYGEEFKKLRECLDSGNYRHGVKIKQLMREGLKKDKQLRFKKFVEDLKTKGVRGKEYREAVAQWNKENPG